MSTHRGPREIGALAVRKGVGGRVSGFGCLDQGQPALKASR